jgi:lambda repressor-like predicted transcriptional regulator
MYRVTLNDEQYESFKVKAKIAMLEKGISRKELSKRINYADSTVKAFFSKQNSKLLAYAIAEALGLEVDDYEET